MLRRAAAAATTAAKLITEKMLACVYVAMCVFLMSCAHQTKHAGCLVKREPALLLRVIA